MQPEPVPPAMLIPNAGRPLRCPLMRWLDLSRSLSMKMALSAEIPELEIYASSNEVAKQLEEIKADIAGTMRNRRAVPWHSLMIRCICLPVAEGIAIRICETSFSAMT